MKIENVTYKQKILEENARQAKMSTLNYINESTESDPGFFRWLFGNEASEYDDFVCPDQEEFNTFCEDYLEEVQDVLDKDIKGKSVPLDDDILEKLNENFWDLI